MKKFPGLAAAGRELAEALQEYRGARDTVAVAITTAGVPVAAELSRAIQLPLELLMIRRLLVPAGAATPVCAVNVAGNLVVDEQVGPRRPAPVTGKDHAIADGLEQLAERERAFRGGRAPLDLARKNVVLVDNGIHTGATISVGIRSLRRLEVASIVVAVPIANADVRSAIEQQVERVVCLAWLENFGHVGMWYQELVRPTEQEIRTFFEDTCDKVSAHERISD